jgi:hypothetical protein
MANYQSLQRENLTQKPQYHCLLSGAHAPLAVAQVSDSLQNKSVLTFCPAQAGTHYVGTLRDQTLSEVVSESRIWRAVA